MKFRDIDVDDIKIIESSDYEELAKHILSLGETFIVVDLQYSTRVEMFQSPNYPVVDREGHPILYPCTVYSVLALLRKK